VLQEGVQEKGVREEGVREYRLQACLGVHRQVLIIRAKLDRGALKAALAAALNSLSL
jgi:hypothetical protein